MAMSTLPLSILLGVIGPWQIVLVVVVLLLLFGGKKIPELMRGLGQGMKEFKDATQERGQAKRGGQVDPPFRREYHQDLYRGPRCACPAAPRCIAATEAGIGRGRTAQGPQRLPRTVPGERLGSKPHAVDARVKAGDAGPLAGLVLSIKDNICYKDHKVSASIAHPGGLHLACTAPPWWNACSPPMP